MVFSDILDLFNLILNKVVSSPLFLFLMGLFASYLTILIFIRLSRV